MKRKAWLAILLSLVMLVGMLSLTACDKKDDTESTKPAFESEEEFLSCIEDTIWYYEDETCLRLRLFGTEENTHYIMAYDLEVEDGEEYQDMFSRMLVALKQEGKSTTYDDVTDFLLAAQDVFDIYTFYDDVEYDWETGIVTDGDNVWEFSSRMLTSNMCHYIEDDTLVLLNSYFKDAEKQVFLANYPDLVTAKDVRYDIYANLGKNFALEGTVKLDDYFNYEYRDLDSIYFCMHVTPAGGSAYTDQWYIYANRSEFEVLKNVLMEKTLSDVTLICRASYTNAGKNRMATLVDFCVG